MANKTRLRIITPDRTFFDDMAELVIMRTSTGDVGIMPGHIPLTTTLACGVVIISNDDKEYKATLMGGFAEVLPSQITIVSDAAEWPQEIDKDRAESAKKRAEDRISSQQPEIDVHRAELALRKSLVRLEVSSYKLDAYQKPVKLEQV